MTKRTNKRKNRKIDDLIDPAAEMATHAAPIDHETQLGSWTPSEAPQPEPLTDDAMHESLTGEEEAIVEALETKDAAHEAAVEAPTAPATEQGDWDSQIAALDEAKVDQTVFATADQIDARAAFETTMDPGNANIHRTLKKARTQMVTKRAAKVMLATNVDPAFMNRSVQEGARYNVYAIGKLADLVVGLTGGVISNAINRAITKSLFQCKNGGVTFTGEVAKAAASDKIRIEPSIRKFLVSHTVSASTAPTQASSTMQALETLGVVKVEGSRRHPTYTVLDTPVARKLEELVLKAA